MSLMGHWHTSVQVTQWTLGTVPQDVAFLTLVLLVMEAILPRCLVAAQHPHLGDSNLK